MHDRCVEQLLLELSEPVGPLNNAAESKAALQRLSKAAIKVHTALSMDGGSVAALGGTCITTALQGVLNQDECNKVCQAVGSWASRNTKVGTATA